MMQPSIQKSQKHSNMIETNFYSLYSIMAGSKIIAGSQAKVCHLIFFDFVGVLPPFCCNIGWGMPYLCIFVQEVVTLLVAITDKWV